MSSDEIERLRAVYAEWGRGRFEAGADLYAPDVVFEPMSDGRERLGRDEIPGYMREFLSQWRDFSASAEELVDCGASVLVTERQTGTGQASGAETSKTFYSVWRFRDHAVVGVRWFDDRAQALEAARRP